VFIVDLDSPGISVTRDMVHMMGDVTHEIALDDVKVPLENLVGEEGQGMREAQSWISRNRVQQAAHGLGVTQRCLEMIGKFAQQRVTRASVAHMISAGPPVIRKLRERRRVQALPVSQPWNSISRASLS
jgi:alkylation response protein AidB-like acyl-CoA dehydrogenase